MVCSLVTVAPGCAAEGRTSLQHLVELRVRNVAGVLTQHNCRYAIPLTFAGLLTIPGTLLGQIGAVCITFKSIWHYCSPELLEALV
jgi:hypothetical protein